MAALRIGSVFSGIGGLDLGVERAGLGRVVFHCEWEDFQSGILQKHWPRSTVFRDIRELGVSIVVPEVDILVGGFPCTGFSKAGKRDGLRNEESKLWFDMLRVIEQAKPIGVIIENVHEMLAERYREDLKTIYQGLDGLGYVVDAPIGIDSSEVGAPHRRERVFLCALKKSLPNVRSQLQPSDDRHFIYPAARGEAQKPSEPPRTGVKFERVPFKRQRIESHGNAVVPDVGREIGLHLVRRIKGEPRLSIERRPSPPARPLGSQPGAKFWPTVITTDCKGSRRNTARGEHWTCSPGESLTDAVWLNDPADYNRPLNPDWTEMLMGFPKGWTVP